jgi:phage head maturation protease
VRYRPTYRIAATRPAGVDTTKRIVTGLAVPWDVEAMVQGAEQPIRFVRGSLQISEHARLLRDHDPHRVIGRPLWDHFVNVAAGLRSGFVVSRTQAGEDVLTDAADGIVDGLSIGADLVDVVSAGDALVVRHGIVREVSLVGMPAFASARLGD